MLPEPPAKEKKSRGRNAVKEGKKGGKGVVKSSVTPQTESASDTEPAADSMATDKPDSIDITAEDLEAEIASLDTV